MCKEPGYKRNSPCSKPAREKEFELHTVSEIILDVVWNMIWRLITAAFQTQNQRFSNRAEIEGYEAWLEWVIEQNTSETCFLYI